MFKFSFSVKLPIDEIRRLSGKSRIEMTNGRLTTMVSADASFLVGNSCGTYRNVARTFQSLSP